jgi:glutaryl-CoA dehydrogenase
MASSGPIEGFIDFELLLTEEEIAIRDTIRRFVDGEFLPLIKDHHRQGTFPLPLIPRLAELGILGASIPDYDLPGLGAIPYGLIMQELERGDSGLRSFVSVQNALVIYPIYHFGTPAQRDHWVPRLAGGQAIGCFGLTEPDFGSNPAAMRTRAHRVQGGYRLQGAKAWITNGTLADVAVIWAKDDSGRIRGFLVEKGTEGFSARAYKGKFSMRASDTAELFLEDCFIEEENLLPQTCSLRHPFACLNEARFGIAWGVLGAAAAVSEHALAYAKERIQFAGQPIASRQIIQEKLVFMTSELAKAQTLIWHLSRLKDQGRIRPEQVSLAKRNNVWMARECARLAREILGAAGIVDDHPVIRHLLNMESVYTYEGTHDMHGLIMGEALTKLAAF